MEIYRSDREKEFGAFLTADSHKYGRRKSILSTLPIYTIKDDLLHDILNKNGIDGSSCRKIEAYVSERKKRIYGILINTHTRIAKDRLHKTEVSI